MNGRLIVCTRCGWTWRVYELPGPFIEPTLYVCGQCLLPMDEADEQLGLVYQQREETREYDPAIARIPF